MIRRGVRIQIVVFVVLGLGLVALAGANYVGLKKLFFPPYKVTAMAPRTAGLFTNSAVTYRGKNIGKVGHVALLSDGVAVSMEINQSEKNIPADTIARIADLSAVGEQYIDLEPRTNQGPYLHDGSVIQQASTIVPVDVSQVLINLDALVNSVDKQDLQVVINELGTAFDNAGPALTQLIERGNSLTTASVANLPQTTKLIADSKTVLTTNVNASSNMRTFAANLAQLSTQLRQSDPDVRRLLDNGIRSARQLDQLLRDNEATLPVLLGNLLTVNNIQAARLPGVEQVLVSFPDDIKAAFLNAPGDGTSHMILDNNQLPLCTDGYTTPRRPADAPDDSPANVKAACQLPHVDPMGRLDRGSRNAPRPPGDTTDPALQPGGAAASAASATGSSTSPGLLGTVQQTSYDPSSGLLIAPNGSSMIMGSDGGQQSVFGSDSWKYLMLSTLGN